MGLFKNEDLYNKEIQQAAQEEGVPMSALKGFFALESQFDAKAYLFEPTHNDASYGIAQILYKTAKGYGFAGKPEDLFDPYLSAKWGAKVIRALHDKYENDLDVIAAYNAGYPRKIQDTTSYIATLFKYPLTYKDNPPEGWEYANQCYVDRVGAYIAYYAAVEKGDKDLASQIQALLAQKSNWPAEFGKYTQVRRLLRPIYFPPAGMDQEMKTEIERWGLILVSLGIIYFAVKNIHTAATKK